MELVHKAPRQALRIWRILEPPGWMILACLCLIQAGGAARQREVAGDRMLLQSFSYANADSALRWQGSLGYLDSEGKYRAVLDPLSCALHFNLFKAVCGDQSFELSPAGYANSAMEFNAILEHLYKIAAIVEKERQKIEPRPDRE